MVDGVGAEGEQPGIGSLPAEIEEAIRKGRQRADEARERARVMRENAMRESQRRMGGDRGARDHGGAHAAGGRDEL